MRQETSLTHFSEGSRGDWVSNSQKQGFDHDFDQRECIEVNKIWWVLKFELTSKWLQQQQQHNTVKLITLIWNFWKRQNKGRILLKFPYIIVESWKPNGSRRVWDDFVGSKYLNYQEPNHDWLYFTLDLRQMASKLLGRKRGGGIIAKFLSISLCDWF